MSAGWLPFSAVVGQEDAKLALVLAALEPRIGGVLLRGDKGTAKSTLARGLAALLPGGAPFVELPIGATEDRVVGSLDVRAALTGGEIRFSPGLLAAADGGVLYVDEINLLPDHLVDVLLDVAASGTNRVEREGVSHSHPSRFLLIGSMNPEEGELRPQLLDRFGLAVGVRSVVEPAERAAAVRRRLSFDASGPSAPGVSGFDGEEAELAARLASARPGQVTDELVLAVSTLCASVGAEGLRADLTICRAAAALAGWEGRTTAGPDDVRRVAAFALTHRARRDPMEPAGMDQDRLEAALDDHVGGDGGSGEGGSGDGGRGDGGRGDGGSGDGDGGSGDGSGGDGSGGDGERPPIDPAPQGRPIVLPAAVRPGRRDPGAPGRHGNAVGRRGRQIGAQVPDGAIGPVGPVAVEATVRATAARLSAASASGSGPAVEPRLAEPGDLREAVHEQRTARLVVIAVDASGSMGATERVAAARGAVFGLLLDAYQRRDLVGLVAFRGEDADVLLRPTSSVEVARARLATLPTGGRTPLAAGITAGLKLAVAPSRAGSHQPLLVVITDGRATFAPHGLNPVEAAAAAGDAVRRSGIDAVVIDVEGTDRGGRLGLARDLATRMGARHVPIERITPVAVRSALDGVR